MLIGDKSFWATHWSQGFMNSSLLASSLSSISEQLRDHSLTSIGSVSSAATFCRDVGLRDGACVVTQEPVALIASHLIPKRVGNDGAKEVVSRFVAAREACNIHIWFHASLGILLVSTSDNLVDCFKLGFSTMRRWETYSNSSNSYYHLTLTLRAIRIIYTTLTPTTSSIALVSLWGNLMCLPFTCPPCLFRHIRVAETSPYLQQVSLIGITYNV